MENWKTIKNFPDYAVSDHGNVKRIVKDLHNRKLRTLKLRPSGCGYLHVSLSKDKKKYDKRVNRLVLETFVRPCPDKMECNHIDGNKHNNCIENLEWVTRSENMKHKYRIGLAIPSDHRGSKNPVAKLIESDVMEIKRLRFNEMLSMYSIAKIFNISYPSVSMICNNKTWRHVE